MVSSPTSPIIPLCMAVSKSLIPSLCITSRIRYEKVGAEKVDIGRRKTQSSIGNESHISNFDVSMPNMANSSLDTSALPEDVREAICFLKSVQILPSLFPPEPLLPPLAAEDSKKPTLVLDLDETLLHCSPCRIQTATPHVTVNFGQYSANGYVYLRPFVHSFLKEISALYEVVVFTASREDYASKLLTLVDPGRRYIRHCLYRRHCTQIDTVYVKDLNLLGRDLRRTCLVDNSAVSIAAQVDNGIVVSPWTGKNVQDSELIELLFFLQKLQYEKNFPVYLAKRFGWRTWLDSLSKEQHTYA